MRRVRQRGGPKPPAPPWRYALAIGIEFPVS